MTISGGAVTTLNLITGFLGAGKTTTVLHLLGRRPAHERWAVLVNEFGEVSIDGALVSSAGGDSVAVREVSGGCICCTGAMSLRVALTRLLRQIRPDRLLLEPTGLGHPAGIIDTLRDPWLARAVTLGNSLCVVDPGGFSADRLSRSAIYRDQISLADVVIINKTDVATPQQIQAVEDYLKGLYPPKRAIIHARRGEVDAAVLDVPVAGGVSGPVLRPLGRAVQAPPADTARGWHFDHAQRFDLSRVQALFAASPWRDLIRAKGVLRTGREWQRFDWAEGRFSAEPVAWRRDSRVECIAPTAAMDWAAIEAGFRGAI
ncbi:GTPase, G3E family [Ectothiorhodospira magna]|uniref:GTPase, G3E family n=1 Tax=Ectothiorhodospira magna TaxID=867345 RepID=A0A1H9F8M8_9GAMM|nr:CobW family GTP-binding protein [Ectothiorhodospira magna]SEQ34302.1 GTPase, G3E family [Ectothiorhodospira magna]